MTNDSRIETVSTRYGDIDVEVVDCTSCEEPVAKVNAEEFTIDDRNGWACRFCSDDPIQYPEEEEIEEIEDTEPLGIGKMFLQFLGMVSLILFALPILALFAYPFGIVFLSFWEGVSMCIFGFISTLVISAPLERMK